MKLLLVTNVFPSPLLPTKGPFNLEMVRALTAGGHQVKAVCPVAWTDEWSAKRRGRVMPPERASADVGGAEALYPRYYFPPKVLREQYGWFMWRSVRSTVMRLLDTFKPDAIVGYWAHPDGECVVRAARAAGVPSAVMVGGSDVLLLTGERRRRQRILDVLHAADAVVPVSEDLKAKLVVLGIAAEKVHVVGRGIDTTKFFPGDRGEARRRLGVSLNQESPVVVWVGRMVPVKGLDVLVRAVAELRNAGFPIRLYLVGDGPLRESLAAQAASLGVADAITFVGAVAHGDLPDWYRAADLAVLPSRSEGVPNVLRESLACGTPFVASNVGGIPEIADNRTCRLVPADDPAALAGGMRDVLSRRGLSDAPPEVRQGSWAESADALVRVIRPLVERSKGKQSSFEPSPPQPAMAGSR